MLIFFKSCVCSLHSLFVLKNSFAYGKCCSIIRFRVNCNWWYQCCKSVLLRTSRLSNFSRVSSVVGIGWRALNISALGLCMSMTTCVLSGLRTDVSSFLGIAKREDTQGVCPKTGSVISSSRSSSILLLTFPQGWNWILRKC